MGSRVEEMDFSLWSGIEVEVRVGDECGDEIEDEVEVGDEDGSGDEDEDGGYNALYVGMYICVLQSNYFS